MAELFSNVTIYFSDLVGFAALCSDISPVQIVDVLNDFYSVCDDVIKNHQVYKVTLLTLRFIFL